MRSPNATVVPCHTHSPGSSVCRFNLTAWSKNFARKNAFKLFRPKPEYRILLGMKKYVSNFFFPRNFSQVASKQNFEIVFYRPSEKIGISWPGFFVLYLKRNGITCFIAKSEERTIGLSHGNGSIVCCVRLRQMIKPIS